MPFSPPISSDKFANMAVLDPVAIPGVVRRGRGLGVAASSRRMSVTPLPGTKRSGRSVRGSVATPAGLRTAHRQIIP